MTTQLDVPQFASGVVFCGNDDGCVWAVLIEDGLEWFEPVLSYSERQDKRKVRAVFFLECGSFASECRRSAFC